MLSNGIIEKLASRSGVRRVAVENFLGTLAITEPRWTHEENLLRDARDYGWNAATQAAIERGIALAYKR